MKFLVDENLPGAVFNELQKKEFDVKKAVTGSSDAEIMALARKEKRVLLTLDKDFADLLAYPPKEYFGIICFRLRRPTFEEIIKNLDLILNNFSGKDISGKLFVITESGIRKR